MSISVPTAERMRDLGAVIGSALRGGDVVVLSGDLGAGKTTLTQGIGRGLGIPEPITSPTFVIARVHDNPTGRPALVHVDAYRLGSVAEVLDLDLDADLDRSVIVVEWGAGLVDGLFDSLVRISITRSDDETDESRVVDVSESDDRWAAVLSVPRPVGEPA